jgi:hypothetical protein
MDRYYCLSCQTGDVTIDEICSSDEKRKKYRHKFGKDPHEILRKREYNEALHQTVILKRGRYESIKLPYNDRVLC